MIDQVPVRFNFLPIPNAIPVPGIQPTEDRILVQRIDEPSNILLTDKPKSIKGVVLAVGPGKWIPGTWWKFAKFTLNGPSRRYIEKGSDDWNDGWEWIPGYRERMDVHVGQIIAFNSRWNDLSHAENVGTGADGKGPLERPLSYKLAANQHLIRQGDVFGILERDCRIEYLGTAIEKEMFVNKRI